jgi:hypothetical protein
MSSYIYFHILCEYLTERKSFLSYRQDHDIVIARCKCCMESEFKGRSRSICRNKAEIHLFSCIPYHYTPSGLLEILLKDCIQDELDDDNMELYWECIDQIIDDKNVELLKQMLILEHPYTKEQIYSKIHYKFWWEGLFITYELIGHPISMCQFNELVCMYDYIDLYNRWISDYHDNQKEVDKLVVEYGSLSIYLNKQDIQIPCSLLTDLTNAEKKKKSLIKEYQEYVNTNEDDQETINNMVSKYMYIDNKLNCFIDKLYFIMNKTNDIIYNGLNNEFPNDLIKYIRTFIYN